MSRIWDRTHRLMLLERMEMYVVAGMQVSDAVSHSGKGLGKKQCESIQRVCLQIEGGQLLSNLLGTELGFPLAVVGIISCGESSGSLAEALKCGHALLEREDELLKKCMSAMTYPLVIAVAAAALTIGLVRGIMPQITPLLKGLHADLPLLTRVVMKASDLLIAYGIWLAVSLFVLGPAVALSYRKLSSVRRAVHACASKIPVLGSLIERYSSALFFQSMGALTSSGVPADKAYAKAVDAIRLIPLKERLSGTVDDIVHGGSFGAVFARGMPAFVAPLVAAGEASGSLSTSFLRASAILDRELDHSLKRITALIEPVMMIFMGCTVGAIALSIMMPIYGISQALQQ